MAKNSDNYSKCRHVCGTTWNVLVVPKYCPNSVKLVISFSIFTFF